MPKDTLVVRLVASVFGKRMLPSGLRVPHAYVKHLRIPLSDGITLDGRLYRRHNGSAPETIVVILTPYGLRLFGNGLIARSLLATNVMVLAVSCRGTFKSEGDFTPFVHDSADGAEVIHWLREQHWSRGRKVVVWGASYEGYAQWATAARVGDQIDGHICQLGASSMRDGFVYQHGALAIADVLAWLRIITAQGNLIRMMLDLRAARREKAAATELPYDDMDVRTGCGVVPWFRDWVRHEVTDSWWEHVEHREAAVERTSAQWHISAGWHDVYLNASLRDYSRLRAAGVQARLMIGPWKHMDAAYASTTIEDALPLLRGEGVNSGVALWPLGDSKGWLEFPSWPPHTKRASLYITSPGRLSPNPPGVEDEVRLCVRNELTDSWGGVRAFDPRNPARDNRPREESAQVQFFTAHTWASGSMILGTPSAALCVHSERAGCIDVHVRLCEVTPDGQSRYITEGFYRGQVDAGTTRLPQIDLAPSAYVLRSEATLRVQVAPSSFPRWGPNPGIDGMGQGTLGEWHLVSGSDYKSRLSIPYMRRNPVSRGQN